MKKHLLFLFLTFWVTLTALAQQKPDAIIKRNGEKLQGYVRQISDKEIFYGQDDMPANVFKTVFISDVAAILYWDGKIQTFAEPPKQPQDLAPAPAPAPDYAANIGALPASASGLTLSPEALYAKGLRDGGTFYTRHTGAGTGTFLISLLGGPLLGLIPAIACASTPPTPYRLDTPITPYAQDPQYVRGYKQGAFKKKKKKVWTNFGFGSGLAILFVLVTAK
jgi:hypothetical protein